VASNRQPIYIITFNNSQFSFNSSCHLGLKKGFTATYVLSSSDESNKSYNGCTVLYLNEMDVLNNPVADPGGRAAARLL